MGTMRRFGEAASRKRGDDEPEVDRVPGTTKIRTYTASKVSLYSEEDTIENIVKSVRFCSSDSKKQK